MDSNKTILEKNLDIKEAAELLNMSVGWLREQVLKRRIPFYKIGRNVRFRASELEEYIQNCKQGSLN